MTNKLKTLFYSKLYIFMSYETFVKESSYFDDCLCVESFTNYCKKLVII